MYSAIHEKVYGELQKKKKKIKLSCLKMVKYTIFSVDLTDFQNFFNYKYNISFWFDCYETLHEP